MEEKTKLLQVLTEISALTASGTEVDLTPLVITLRGIEPWFYFPCSNEKTLNQLSELEELEKAYMQLMKDLHSHGSVKWFKGREDSEFGPEDFEGVAVRVAFSLCVFQILLEKVHASNGRKNFPDVYNRVFQNLCIYGLLLIGEHQDEQLMWSSVVARQAASKTLNCMFKVCSGSLDEILTHPNEESCLSSGLLSSVLTEIQPRLTKETWKQNPSVKHIYCWLLTNTNSPYLGEHLDLLFPPPLMFLDHHQVENKVIGVKCLQHILAETSTSEIQWYGRTDVMYQVLQHQLYQHEPELLQNVLPCLLKLLKITEFSSSSVCETCKGEDRFDEIMPRILSDMETETRIVVRREYTRHLKDYIEPLGIRNVKYYKRLLQLFAGYLEIYDGPEEVARLNILQSLELLIKATWPRVPAHSMEICKMLVKLLWDMSTDTSATTSSVTDEVFRKAVSCLVWLRKASRKQTDELIQSILKIDTMPVKIQHSLKSVISCP